MSKKILIKTLSFVLASLMVFLSSTTAITALDDEATTLNESEEENSSDVKFDFPDFSISGNDKEESPEESETEENLPEEDNKPVGDIVVTKDTFQLRMNADGKTYTVVGYLSSSDTMNIPESYNGYKITRIADFAFQGKVNLKYVSIPDSIEYIGSEPFAGCSNITKGATTYGNAYYLGNVNNPYLYLHKAVSADIESVEIYEGDDEAKYTKFIGSYAFQNCTKLKEISVPETVVQIGFKAFRHTDSLESITLPFVGETGSGDTNSHLGYVFGAQTFGGNISYIPTSLKKIEILGGERMAKNSFYGVDMVEELTLPFVGETKNGTENTHISYIWGFDTYEGNANLPASLKKITVLDGEVGSHAFYGCIGIEEVALPENLTVVNDHLFYGCSSLRKVNVPDGVTSIGSYAFYNCLSLMSVIFEENSQLVRIGSYAFGNCDSLMSITIESNVTIIDTYAFWGCYKLIEVYNYSKLAITAGLIDHGFVAYYAANVYTTQDATNDFVEEDNYVFYCINEKNEYYLIDYTGTDIELVLPRSINGNNYEIYKYAFKGFDNIISVIIPNGVTCIGENAFLNCSSLTSLTVGTGVTSIGKGAFNYCNNLTSVHISDITKWCNISFGSSDANPLCYANNLFLNGDPITDLVIPDGVTSIGDYAFSWCSGLTSVTIPDSVISIGSSAFYGCNNITTATIPVLAIEHISKTNLQTVVITSGENISERAFYNGSKLTSIVIPNSVTSIGAYAFYGCSILTNVTIPSSVSYIGFASFGECGSLEKLTIPFIGETKDGTDNTHFGYIFGANEPGYNDDYVPSSLKTVIINGNTAIGPSAFYLCSNITDVTLQNGVTGIGSSAFAGCTSLTSVKIPNSVTVIGDNAFRSCQRLASITIPVSVTNIGKNAFRECLSLYIYCEANSRPPEWSSSWNYSDCPVVWGYNGVSLAKDDDHAFFVRTLPHALASQTPNAAKIYFRQNSAICYDVNTMVPEAQAFSEGLNYILSSDGSSYSVVGVGTCIDTDIIIPSQHNGLPVTSIDSFAFYNCSKLVSITIPDGVTSIGSYAFSYCSSLSSVTIPNSVASIGDNAFQYCYKLNYNRYDNAYYLGNETNPYLVLVQTPTLVLSCNIHEETKFIHSDAFSYRTDLTEINIPNNVTSIGARAFESCSSLKTIAIGSRVTSIGDYVFKNCTNLKTVLFEGNSKLNNIGTQAFYGCSIDILNLPNSITKIGSEVFANCSALKTINYDGEELEWRYIQKATNWDEGMGEHDIVFKPTSGLLFEMKEDTSEFYVSEFDPLLLDPSGKPFEVTIPERFSGRPVTTIFKQAFYNIDCVSKIEIADTVKTIGEHAFLNCTGLQELKISSNVELIEFGALDGCTALETLVLPFLGNNVEINENDYLGYTFGAHSYSTHVAKIPKSLKSVTVLKGDRITSHAFASCSGLQAISIPADASYIGDKAFEGCSGLKSFTIPDSVERVGIMIFDGCIGLEEIRIGAALSVIDDYGLGNPLFGMDKSRSLLKKYTVSSANSEYLADDKGILYAYITISDNGEKIPTAVMDVPAKADLSNYALPEFIVEIAPYAFAYCSTLYAIDLKHVRRVANNAFYNSSSLINVTFSANEWEKYSGNNKEALESGFDTYINNSSKKIEEINGEVKEQYYSYIGDRAFMGCVSLQCVELGADNIIGVGDYSFADCPKLTEVKFGDKIEKIGFSAFGATASGENNIEMFVVSSGNSHYKSIDGVLFSVNSDGSLTLETCPGSLIKPDGVGSKVYVTEYTVPADMNVVAIQTYAFQSVNYINSVTVDTENKIAVGDYAFANSRLKNVYIGENVTSLGLIRGEGEYTVFADMEYLTAIEVDKDNSYYTSEGGVLFDKAKRTLIKYPASKTGNVYELPSTVEIIASMAFKRNSSLIYVTVPSYVSVIGLEAFYACDNLSLIYFDSVYAPVSVMENAFTTFVEVEDGIVIDPRTQIGYSDEYYHNGSDGEYGWCNYSDTYNLAIYDRLPELQRGEKGDGFYAVVVVDTQGRRLGNMKISLTDPNGKTETVVSGRSSAGKGIAVFYDLFGVEGLGFSLDFSAPYSLRVEDMNGVYSPFVNPTIRLDEDMRITYVTLTQEPSAYGVNCGNQDINTQTADLNKAQYDYECAIKGEHTHEIDGLNCINGVIRETVEISVIGYCDPSMSFVDEEGNLVDDSMGLYQNGIKVADVTRYDAERSIFYFNPCVYTLAPETDIEVRLVAKGNGKTLSCRTVLNIHVFDFIVTGDNVEIDDSEMYLDFSEMGDLMSKLVGKDGLKFSMGKNVKFGVNVEGDTVTLSLKGEKKKEVLSYSSFKEGYFAESKAHNQHTYEFTYYGVVNTQDLKLHTLMYVVRFARDRETENYYYYSCTVYDRCDEPCGENCGKEVDRFFGGVNGMINSKLSADTRSSVAPKAMLIYLTHLGCAISEHKLKDLDGHIYSEKFEATMMDNEVNSDLKLSLSGDLKFKYHKEKGFEPISATIKGEISYTFEWDTQLIVWVIPVTVEVDITAEGAVTLNFKADENRKLKFDDVEFEFDMDVEVYGGIGCKGFSGGVYGSVGVLYVLELAPDFGVERWELSADIGAKVKALWWTKKFSIWNGELSKDYDDVEEGGNNSGSGGGDVWTLREYKANMASTYLVDTYTLARGDDLESGFRLVVVDDTLYKISFVDMSGYDGYDEYNYAKLALSKWNGSDWDTPELVDGNCKKNDAAYTLIENDSGTYIVYTQQTKWINAKDGDDTYVGASDLCIKMVKLTSGGVDGEIDVVSDKRDNYVYLPQYAVIDNVPTIVWAENADNNMLGVSPHNYCTEAQSDNESNGNGEEYGVKEYHVFDTTANSIWISRFDGENWSNPECIQSGLSPITDLVITSDGVISYIIDEDSDLSSSNDRVMYCRDVDGSSEAINETSKGSITSVMLVDDALVYYYDVVTSDDHSEEDRWVYLTEKYNEELPDALPSEFVPVCDENGALIALIYSTSKTEEKDLGEKNGISQIAKSDFYGIFFENGVWGQPVLMTTLDGYISEFDAELTDDSKLIVYSSISDMVNDTVSTNTYVYELASDLIVKSYEIDYANSSIKIIVTNNGAISCSVYASINSNEAFVIDHSLGSGETCEYVISLEGSPTLEYDLTISTDEHGNGIQEINDLDLNYSDIQPFAKQLLLGDKNTILVAVKNTGNVQDEGKTVVGFINGNNELEVIWEITESIAPGQIMYHEVDLSDTAGLHKNSLIFVTSTSVLGYEKGSAESNNIVYVTYAEATGVLDDNEQTHYSSEVVEDRVVFDKQKDDSILLNYVTTYGVRVSNVYIGTSSLSGRYHVETKTVGGVITIDHAFLETLSGGEYSVRVCFSNGDEYTLSLYVVKYYSITWMDEDASLGESVEVAEGSMPSLGYVPQTKFDDKYQYQFIGWSTEMNGHLVGVTSANSDATYYAVWKQIPREFTITWVMISENGNQICVNECYTYGQMPNYAGTVFAPSNMCFSNWDKEIASVTGDVTYNAIYASDILIGDVNGDGVINTRDVALLRQYIAEEIELTGDQFLRGNVFEDYSIDGSPRINTRDVAILQQYIVGYIDSLD